jgi:hypothetical protein
MRETGSGMIINELQFLTEESRNLSTYKQIKIDKKDAFQQSKPTCFQNGM